MKRKVFCAQGDPSTQHQPARYAERNLERVSYNLFFISIEPGCANGWHLKRLMPMGMIPTGNPIIKTHMSIQTVPALKQRKRAHRQRIAHCCKVAQGDHKAQM
jgi:hypothetical protein